MVYPFGAHVMTMPRVDRKVSRLVDQGHMVKIWAGKVSSSDED
jgi:hypothetical protein